VQSIGLALMRFSTGFEPWKISGLIFVIISFIFMGYSIVRYEQRRSAIASKSKGPYSDRFGPPILVGLLLAAVFVNIIIVYKLYFSNSCTGISLLGLSFVTYSPTSLVWNSGLGKLLSVQNDVLTMLDVNELTTKDFMAPGNHYGLTMTPNSEDLIYLGNKYPASIDEFSISQGRLLRRFPLWIPGANNSVGISGIAFIPQESNPEGGSFWVGSSVDGSVYVYNLPLRTNTSSIQANITGSFYLLPGMTDLKSLSYHADTNLVYGIMGQWLFKINPFNSSTLIPITLLGFPDPTGLAIVGSGSGMEIYISCGKCSNIWKFPFSDGNGISSGRCYPETVYKTDASLSSRLTP